MTDGDAEPVVFRPHMDEPEEAGMDQALKLTTPVTLVLI
jgi:hypothetical protein